MSHVRLLLAAVGIVAAACGPRFSGYRRCDVEGCPQGYRCLAPEAVCVPWCGESAGCVPLTTGSGLLPGAALGVPYRAALSASGGTTPYRWELEPAAVLPAGIFLSTEGILAGSPDREGTASFAVRVEDSDPRETQKATAELTLAVAARLQIQSTTLPAAVMCMAYRVGLVASGGTPPYSWKHVAGALPAGTSLDAGGNVSGAPTVAGTFPITVEVTDSFAPAQLVSGGVTLNVWPGVLVVTTAALPRGRAGQPYNVRLGATGGTVPQTYVWSLCEGSLPEGLSLSSQGDIAGTPLAAGTTGFTVRVLDARGDSGAKWLTLTVD